MKWLFRSFKRALKGKEKLAITFFGWCFLPLFTLLFIAISSGGDLADGSPLAWCTNDFFPHWLVKISRFLDDAFLLFAAYLLLRYAAALEKPLIIKIGVAILLLAAFVSLIVVCVAYLAYVFLDSTIL